MKALIKSRNGTGPLELRDVDEPACGPHEIKIEVQACGICATDLHIRDGLYPWHPDVPLGHEYSGLVVEAGGNVSGVRVGDRVAGCGHGGFARYVVTDMQHGRVHVRLPDHVSFEEGALLEPLAASTRAVLGRSGIAREHVVLVTGPGTTGLCALQVAKQAGAVVIAVGTPRGGARLELAARLGADYTAGDDTTAEDLAWGLTEGCGVDAALECSGAPAALDLAIRLIAYEGRITQFGLFGRPVQVDLDGLMRRNAALVSSLGYDQDSWERAAAMVSDGRVRLRELISDVLPLSEWSGASTHAAGGRASRSCCVRSDTPKMGHAARAVNVLGEEMLHTIAREYGWHTNAAGYDLIARTVADVLDTHAKVRAHVARRAEREAP